MKGTGLVVTSFIAFRLKYCPLIINSQNFSMKNTIRNDESRLSQPTMNRLSKQLYSDNN